MTDCELLKTCIFFNDKMQNMPSTAEVIKLRYCNGDYTDCARFTIFKAVGREKVPQDLFPNQIEKAREIIAGS
ncbi:MAG: hypothetical protein CXR31_14490 [Geobacter sp.]|nr:MAG: hypothetical protein CXR31_14490 [Geobacter sp.]